MAKNQKNTQKTTNRAVNTKGSMQTTNKASDAADCTNTTNSKAANRTNGGCGCGTKGGDGDRKK